MILAVVFLDLGLWYECERGVDGVDDIVFVFYIKVG